MGSRGEEKSWNIEFLQWSKKEHDVHPLAGGNFSCRDASLKPCSFIVLINLFIITRFMSPRILSRPSVSGNCFYLLLFGSKLQDSFVTKTFPTCPSKTRAGGSGSRTRRYVGFDSISSAESSLDVQLGSATKPVKLNHYSLTHSTEKLSFFCSLSRAWITASSRSLGLVM